MLSLPIVIGAVGVVLVVWGASVFNGLVGLRNRYRNAFAQIDVQLKRRLRPHPESRRDGEGLPPPRARGARGRGERAQPGRERQRPRRVRAR
jgi:hypothetical protein